ncbi:MAG: DUF1080 domain-containing protein [Planctomycetes bacterium]|nr:DUF1080 domain-containing protein [Planctomycetota bacterium]
MKNRIICYLMGITIGLFISGCASETSLFNERNLDNWTFHLKNSDIDPATVWSVQDGVLRCEGKPSGYIRTTEDYSNYKLHVEWRWPEKPSNSGVLLHMSEPDKIWPKAIEAQLMNQNAGDFYVIGGTDFKEHKGKEDRRVPKINDASEKKPGQWNAYDIICRDNTIELYVNGVFQNKATETTVNSGKIGLQSEGSPIEFRNIKLEPLK